MATLGKTCIFGMYRDACCPAMVFMPSSQCICGLDYSTNTRTAKGSLAVFRLSPVIQIYAFCEGAQEPLQRTPEMAEMSTVGTGPVESLVLSALGF